MSATKRRAAAVASPDNSTPEPKRRKKNDDTFFPEFETVESTQEIGRKLISLLKRSQDKNGRNVATHFLHLPSKSEYPQYYAQVKMPLSINMVEQRIEAGQYDTVEKLESDLKRLVQNAKEFNATKSEVFEDAERIRKALSNFMPKHNPAYQDSNYRAYPTPIPKDLLDQESVTPPAQPNGLPKLSLKLTTNRTERRKSQAASTEDDRDDATNEATTKQLELLDQLSDQPDAINFEERPPRSIKGYYQQIKRPTSISDVRKMIQQGKLFDWNAFAAEVRLIWSNAKDFNEDGSEIYLMAEELETWFEERVQKHGASLQAPASIKLKVKEPQHEAPKLKLSFGARSTPTPVGTNVDSESLRRQKEEMARALNEASRASSMIAVTNGTTPIPPSLVRSASVAEPKPTTTQPQPSLDPKRVDIVKPPAPLLNHISQQLPTPAVNGVPPGSSLATPATANGVSYAQPAYPQKPPNPFAESDNPIDRKFRDPGRGIESALLGSVTFMTHPDLQNNPRWKLDRFASPTRTQTSSYIYLPSDHYYLRVIPHLSEPCKRRRRYKVVVTRNWDQVYQSQANPGVYDFRIHPGENIIAVDVIADLAEGEKKEYAPPQLQVDFERIMFVIMLREPAVMAIR